MGRRRIAASLIVLLTAASSVACGYALAGRGNTLPSNVRVIGVPTFVNESTTPEVEREISDAVRQEFASRGSLRAVPDEQGVDAVLRGTVTNVHVQPMNLNSAGQATRYQLSVTARVEFINLLDDDAVLWSNPNARYSEDYDVPPGTTAADPAAFFRQDVNALQRVARNFARSVVTSILEAF